MSHIRSSRVRAVSVVAVLGALGFVATTGCAMDPGDGAAETSSAIGDEKAPAPGPAPAPAPGPGPGPNRCLPPNKVVDLNQPPYSSLTATELRECLDETVVDALLDRGKDVACLSACVASGPLYPFCALACGLAAIGDGVLNTLNTGICFREQFNKRPIKKACLTPAEQIVPPNYVSCDEAGGTGKNFNRTLAFLACKKAAEPIPTDYSQYGVDYLTCGEVWAKGPGTEAREAAIRYCNSLVQGCVTATANACNAPPLPVPKPAGLIVQ